MGAAVLQNAAVRSALPELTQRGRSDRSMIGFGSPL